MLVFTNLTQDHLDFHGTMEEYFEAKRGLFAQAERAVVNVGDEWGRRLAAEPAGRAHVHAATTSLEAIELQLPGRFNGRTRSARCWAARALGIDEDAIRGASSRWRACRAGSSRSTRVSRSR